MASTCRAGASPDGERLCDREAERTAGWSPFTAGRCPRSDVSASDDGHCVMRFLSALAMVAVAALGIAAVGVAARQPTRAERQAITNALPKDIRAMPVGCVWLNIRVSKDPRYAYVAPEVINTTPPPTQCLPYASNGFY